MTGTSTRTHGERGVAIILTALALIPLMTFAAFGVDLASWYSRSSFLQKSADAAALAGTVWMPNLGKSTTVACDSLLENGIDGGDCGTGPFGVEIDRGSTSTSLRVTVTDPNATRYFSQVIDSGNQALTRSAEAEYNLPIPLGSPLNYFGGDYTRTVPPTPPDTYTLNWPTSANSSSRRPAVAQVGDTAQGFNCNVGTLSAQGYGRWTSATNYEAANFGGSSVRCNYSVTFTLPGGTPSNVPPPDYTRRAPTNAPCNVFQTATTNGRWETATTYNNTARYVSGNTGFRQCTWAVAATSDRPNFSDGSNIPPGSAPVNRPCRVGYETASGGGDRRRPARWSASGAPSGGTQARRQPLVPLAGRRHDHRRAGAAEPDRLHAIARVLGSDRGSQHLRDERRHLLHPVLHHGELRLGPEPAVPGSGQPRSRLLVRRQGTRCRRRVHRHQRLRRLPQHQRDRRRARRRPLVHQRLHLPHRLQGVPADEPARLQRPHRGVRVDDRQRNRWQLQLAG